MKINYASLNQPVNPYHRKDYQSFITQGRRLWFGLNPASWVIALVVAGGLILTGASIYNYSVAQRVIGLIVVAVGILPLAALVKIIVSYRSRLDRSVKAYVFALRNRLVYAAQIRDPKRDGIIFSDPKIKGSFIYDLISRKTGRPFEIGNYYYQVGSGNNQTLTSRYFGFIAIKLDRKLPHMVLDAAANKVKIAGLQLKSFGVPFETDQVLKLEGNFNDYFTLYVPKRYEADALYVFTPDLMARLIDNAAIFSAEVIDDTLYLYSGTPFYLDRQATYEQLFTILETVGSKALKQTRNYKDTQAVAVGEIAEPGRRLRRGKPIAYWIIIFVIVAAIIAANSDKISQLFK